MFSFFLDYRLIATFSFVKNQMLELFTYQMLLLRAHECVQLGYLQFTKCDNISGVKIKIHIFTPMKCIVYLQMSHFGGMSRGECRRSSFPLQKIFSLMSSVSIDTFEISKLYLSRRYSTKVHQSR